MYKKAAMFESFRTLTEGVLKVKELSNGSASISTDAAIYIGIIYNSAVEEINRLKDEADKAYNTGLEDGLEEGHYVGYEEGYEEGVNND